MKELELKRKEEERLKEEERIRDEERRKKQMEIEAKIEREKIEKELMKKEIEKEKELERQKEIEKQKEIERQKELERQRQLELEQEIERQKRLEEEEKIKKEKEAEELLKKEEMEKMKIELDKLKEEEIKELPQDINLNLEETKNNNNLQENKNKEMNIQDLLELEEQNEQNFEYFHIKEKENNEFKEENDNKEVIKSEENLIKQEEENINEDNNENQKNNENIEEIITYRQISILELIHDAPKFSPIFFTFLSFKDLLEFTSISKKIKRQRIYIFNLQKQNILNYIGVKTEENLENKIKDYEENYSNNKLNEPFIELHLSKGALRAIQLLNNNTYSKIFGRPVLEEKYNPIYLVYRLLFIFLGEEAIVNIFDDKLFWVKCTEFLSSNSENGKIGDFISKKFENYKCDNKTIYLIEKLMKGKKENISPSYYSKICGSTGLLIFGIKELLEYSGVIIDSKKTQLSRIYQNLKYYKNMIDVLTGFNKTLENFNQ